jgi:hypothetical protein
MKILKELAKDAPTPGTNLTALAKYCSYEKRPKRLNHEQYMDKLFGLS